VQNRFVEVKPTSFDAVRKYSHLPPLLLQKTVLMFTEQKTVVLILYFVIFLILYFVRICSFCILSISMNCRAYFVFCHFSHFVFCQNLLILCFVYFYELSCLFCILSFFSLCILSISMNSKSFSLSKQFFRCFELQKFQIWISFAWGSLSKNNKSILSILYQ